MFTGYDLIFFAAIAIFLAWKLYSVLGRRTGNERSVDPFATPPNQPGANGPKPLGKPGDATVRQGPATERPGQPESASAVPEERQIARSVVADRVPVALSGAEKAVAGALVVLNETPGIRVIGIGMTARSIRETCSCAISTCRVGVSVRPFMTTATVNTRCEGPRPGRSRRSACFAWCPPATSAATTTGRPIHGPATSAILVSKVSSEWSASMVIGTMSSC